MQTRLLQQLCSVPTAPFAEQYVVAFVEKFVAARPRLKLTRDRVGNLLIELPCKSPAAPGRWLFAAHMDHPGCVAEEMTDARTLRARFHGGVRAEYVNGSAVRFFDGTREVAGRVTDVATDAAGASPYPSAVTVRVSGPVSPGSPGMFDQGGGRVDGEHFLSRVCDDLAGAAACLTMLDALLRSSKHPPRVTIGVLLTRAEEEGFVGAFAAARTGKFIRKTDRLIAIECSSAQPSAPLGGGVVIRVGDRTGIFNSGLTYFLSAQADALSKRDKIFKVQRALMPGGTCEATVYDAFGYTAASLCVPLGNYHNMDVKRKRIGPEFIDVNDWQSMTKLFVQVARTAHEFEPGHAALRRRLETYFIRAQAFL